MKKLFTILAVALCSTLALAQTNQYFWANGRFIMGNPIDQIDSISFGQLKNTDSVLLYLPRTVKVIHDTVIQYVSIHDTVYQCGDHQYVDLGLSVKWATCNVGATKPEEYGDYFAWGETYTKTEYTWSTYKYSKGTSYSLTKYCCNSNYGYNNFTDNLTVLLKDDDVASINWGDNWRMPTHEEIEELHNNCSIIWTDNYNGTGVAGRIYTSNIIGYTDKSIFLPAAGYRDDRSSANNLIGEGSRGEYWTSSIYEYSPAAWDEDFLSDSTIVDGGDRSCGLSVRPVYK